jgi:hypothetical protein
MPALTVFGGLALVDCQIVDDGDIAFVEGWGELFLDIGLEDASVHRGVDDEGGACRGAVRRRRSGSSNPFKLIARIGFWHRDSRLLSGILFPNQSDNPSL